MDSGTSNGLLSEQKSFLWRIPNYAEICESEDNVNKQNFKFSINGSEIWQCFLRTCENGPQKSGVGLYIRLENVPQRLMNCHAVVHFKIGSKDNGRIYVKRETNMKVKEMIDVSHGNFLPQLSPNKNIHVLTSDGALEIRIAVTVFHPEKQNAELAALEAKYKHLFIYNFCSQFHALRNSPLEVTSTNTKIVSKHGVEFSVDRVILAARSPIFRTMFQSKMKEEEKSVVELKDMYSQPLEVLLNFLHTGKLVGNWKCEYVIEGLVYGAHTYMLQDLKEFLDNVLGFVCTQQNCVKLARLAKAFKMKKAEQQLLEYFKENLLKSWDDVLVFSGNTAAAAT